MLQNLGSAIRHCLAEAEAARQHVDASTDPTIRQGFLALERSWLNLAQSEQLAERLNLYCSNIGSRSALRRSRADLTNSRDGDRSVPRAPLVVVVDDEEIVRAGMSELIESLGYKTAIFA